MECKMPFNDYVSNCRTAVEVNASLTPDTIYQWLITDKFYKQYSGVATTDSLGNFVILVSDLPPGLLNSYAGDFMLQVKELYSCADVQLNMKQSYDAIIFSVQGGTYEKDNLGCL